MKRMKLPGNLKKLPKEDLIIMGLLVPVILQSLIIIGITMFGFLYSFLG
jgi:hypothetical protein